ncbi:TlpA family protein disulfide reductase [Thermodesulfobacteriota bacterium]
MYRVRLLSGIAIALLYILGNVAYNKFGLQGIIYPILMVLLYLAAIFPTIYRACHQRKQRIILAGLVEGIDVGAIASLLAGVYFLVSQSHPELSSYLPVLVKLLTFGTISILVLCISLSFLLGLAFFLVKPKHGLELEREEKQDQSLFAGRSLISYAPVVLCILIIVAGLPVSLMGDIIYQQSGDASISKMTEFQPKVGETAPDVQSKTLDGKMWRLADQRGKVVLIDFWATWCKPCIESVPMFQRIHETYGVNKNFLVVTVSLDKDRSLLEKFINSHDMKWQILFEDNESTKKEFAEKFGVFSIPSLWIIDKDGKIAANQIFKEEKLKEQINNVLGKPSLL